MKRREDPEEMERPVKKKKKSHRLYAFLVIVLGIAIIVLSVLILFHIQSVEIKGNEYTSDQEIVKIVQNDRFSVNSLYVTGKYLIGQGETLPCFDSMKVSMKAPWKLKITVKEKTAVAYMMSKKEYIYFDKDGLVVRKDTELVPGIPCVEGIDVEKMELYQSLESKDSKMLGEILDASKELKKYKMTIERIVCKNDRIYLYSGKICISIGSSVTSEKIAQIPPIIEKLEGKEGTLHLENYADGQETITFDVGEFPKEN